MYPPLRPRARGKNFSGRSEKKSPKSLEVSEIYPTFANAIKIVVVHSAGRTSDAQQQCRAFFMLSSQPIKRLPFRKNKLPSG